MNAIRRVFLGTWGTRREHAVLGAAVLLAVLLAPAAAPAVGAGALWGAVC